MEAWRRNHVGCRRQGWLESREGEGLEIQFLLNEIQCIHEQNTYLGLKIKKFVYLGLKIHMKAHGFMALEAFCL